jgi:hypothetical protein
MRVVITPPSGTTPGKLGDAEIIFAPGSPFAGMKLCGFSIWERRDGSYNVTFPSRNYTVNGEKRSFALFRPVSEPSAQNAIRKLIIDAFLADRATKVAPTPVPSVPSDEPWNL